MTSKIYGTGSKDTITYEASRRYVGSEVSVEYCEIIKERLKTNV